MKQYLVSPQARADLLSVWLYVAEDNPAAANVLLEEFYEAFTRLAAMPGMGRLRDDLGIGPVRLWTVRQYLVVYRPDTEPLEIVRVVSGYRDMASLFSD